MTETTSRETVDGWITRPKHVTEDQEVKITIRMERVINMSNKVKNQDPISSNDMKVYLNYVLTNHVESSKHAKDLKRLSRRTTTLSDVTVLFRVLTKHQEKLTTQLMDAVQIQQRVLERLGATDEMFNEAQSEYEKEIEEMREQIKAQFEDEEEAESTEEATEDGTKE